MTSYPFMLWIGMDGCGGQMTPAEGGHAIRQQEAHQQVGLGETRAA